MSSCATAVERQPVEPPPPPPPSVSAKNKDAPPTAHNNNHSALSSSKNPTPNQTTHTDSTLTNNATNNKARFKKLRKRATRFLGGGDLSGILQREEWNEIKQALLLQEKEHSVVVSEKKNGDFVSTKTEDLWHGFGPWIGLRQTQKYKREHSDQNKLRDGLDHRLLLKNLILAGCSAATVTPPNTNDNKSIHNSKDAPSTTNSTDEGEANDNNHTNTINKQKKKKKGKKRKHSDPDSEDHSSFVYQNIPPWALLHNPACIDHFAVLEVHIHNNNGSKGDQIRQEVETMMAGINNSKKKNDIDNTNNNNNSSTPSVTTTEDTPPTANHNYNDIATQWFEGPRPQSISDILLYEKPPGSNIKKNKKSKQDETTLSSSSSSQPQLVDTLQSLTLTQADLQKEGYPLPIITTNRPTSDTTADSTTAADPSPLRPPFRNPTSFSLEEATKIVQQSQVQVPEKDFPFVMMSSSTPPPDGSSGGTDRRILAMDCEMVKTDHGIELGRITLIEYTDDPFQDNQHANSDAFSDKYTILMDELVLPYRPILDYVTEYSGITAKLLEKVTTRLEQVQASLLTYIRPNYDIVVGHSLENDLLATRWIHTNVMDTSVLFRPAPPNNNRSFKYSLKHLSAVLLQKKIQQSGSHHCSEEDAAAALELAVRRATGGPTFCVGPNQKIWWLPPTMAAASANHTTGSSRPKNANTNASVFLGPSQWLQDHVTRHPNAIHALTCESMESPNRKAILSWLTGPKRRAHLVWANLVVQTLQDVTLLRDFVVRIPLFHGVCVLYGVAHSWYLRAFAAVSRTL